MRLLARVKDTRGKPAPYSAHAGTAAGVGLGADGQRWDSSRRRLVGDWPFAAPCVGTSRDLLPPARGRGRGSSSYCSEVFSLCLELVSITCPAGSKSQACPRRVSPNSSDGPGLLGRALGSGCPRTVSLGERGPVSLLTPQLKGYFAMVSSRRGLFPPLVTKGAGPTAAPQE